MNVQTKPKYCSWNSIQNMLCKWLCQGTSAIHIIIIGDNVNQLKKQHMLGPSSHFSFQKNSQ